MSTINPAAESGVISKVKAMDRQKTYLGIKIVKYLFFGISSLVLILFVLHAIWKMSGSNQWELEIDEEGVRVYSLKAPGSTIVKFKGVTNYNYTYSHMFGAFNDESLAENCGEHVPGCIEYKFLQPWDSKRMANMQYWRFKIFPPFSDREFVMIGSIYQDSKTKEVLLQNIAAPNFIDTNDCCVRITHLHNTWRYTPLEKGGVQVEFVQDVDMGGFFPDFLSSLAASQVHQLLHTGIPKLIDKEEYRNTKLDFIEEY